jgi:hypothetical protein
LFFLSHAFIITNKNTSQLEKYLNLGEIAEDFAIS